MSLKFIGVDYGGIRTGLAVSRVREPYIQPRDVIEDPNPKESIAMLKNYASEVVLLICFTHFKTYVNPLQLFKNVKESRVPLCLLGFDMREAYTGLAVTDFDLRSAWAQK
ncbi:hypothetical protein LWI29_020791 [Acer saccharum]|uniref:Uncharacterized protein n=1 Tax=Acer saccharum TaxID=4024 RepID=A0AA39T0Z3_ACESA|nr:hypothetical protein LWI29_020791 [Acer saccharum]